jgi:hypothetical protein
MDFNSSDKESMRKLLKLQAYFRQNYVRNEMQKVRNTYEEIFNEIEGNDSDVKVAWPLGDSSSTPCLPEFIDKQQKQTRISKSLLKARNFTETLTNHQIIKFMPPVIDNDKDSAAAQQTISNNNKNKSNKEEALFDVDLNLEQMNYLSIENLKKLSKTELLSVRENVSLEMLWIQQAIQSRLQVCVYLIDD